MSITPSLVKSHAHDVGDPEDESVNLTMSGAGPDLGEPVNFATGGGGRGAVTEVKFLFNLLLLPPALVTLSLTE